MLILQFLMLKFNVFLYKVTIMKNLLLSFLFLSSSVFATETVTFVYAFGFGDTVTNYHRSVIAEANKLQNKYNFIFDSKPGAGGSIAANHVKSTPNTILATSAAFFIRPELYPNESHKVLDFRALLPECASPMAVVSSKYQSWREVSKNSQLSIGVSGVGSTSYLIASQLQSSLPELLIVPFKSIPEAVESVLGGNTDFAIGFIGDVEPWSRNTNNKKLYILGIAGNNAKSQYPLLSAQGFSPNLQNMGAAQHLVVPVDLSESKFNEWRKILTEAEKAQSVRGNYAMDQCEPFDNIKTVEQLNQWYKFQTEHWKKTASTIKIN